MLGEGKGVIPSIVMVQPDQARRGMMGEGKGVIPSHTHRHRRPQEYAPLSSIDCVDLARSAKRTASPAESSRPSIFNCRAVSKRERESSCPTSPAHTAEGRKTGICITFCVRVNKSASEGRGSKKFCFVGRVGEATNVWFLLSPTRTET